MKYLSTIFLLAALTSVAHAEVNDSDVIGALKSRYGPLPPNSTLSISISSNGPYSGKEVVPENNLPEKFLAVVWDQKSNKFAVLVEDESGTPTRIAGTTTLELKIPVLKSKLNIGDVIARNDIEYINIANSNAQNIIKTPQNLIGKEISRAITPGRPVAPDSVMTPNVVKRNQEVQVIYKKGSLELVSKGKALSNATIGDTVKVTRKDSIKTLEGIAVAEGVVEINPGVEN